MITQDLLNDAPEQPRKPSGPVTCLGMTFENDETRWAHFTEELRKKPRDPEFRKIEGFPIGSDEDILNLSDPPMTIGNFLNGVLKRDDLWRVLEGQRRTSGRRANPTFGSGGFGRGTVWGGGGGFGTGGGIGGRGGFRTGGGF